MLQFHLNIYHTPYNNTEWIIPCLFCKHVLQYYCCDILSVSLTPNSQPCVSLLMRMSDTQECSGPRLHRVCQCETTRLFFSPPSIEWRRFNTGHGSALIRHSRMLYKGLWVGAWGLQRLSDVWGVAFVLYSCCSWLWIEFMDSSIKRNSSLCVVWGSGWGFVVHTWFRGIELRLNNES